MPYGGGGRLCRPRAGQNTRLHAPQLRQTAQHPGRCCEALAVTGTKCLADLPDVPTVAEIGLPGIRGVFVDRHLRAGRDARARRQSRRISWAPSSIRLGAASYGDAGFA
ncbi:MAG: hypothetical protein IPJ28_22045 [Betaproteobacteria bacterium]|nr:hypothetical protein [Betaproteobacteria bacterium]